MSVLAFGVNHQSAPLAIRERLAFSPSTTPNALQALLNQPGIEEAVILSTCNRTEIYTTAQAADPIHQWLSEHHTLHDIDLNPFVYHHQGLNAVKHIMRVAAGLDSMVMGEPQILGQMKDAYKAACDIGTVGASLQQLFPAVFATSKHIRSETNIGRCPVSVAYTVVKLCREQFENLNQCNVLLVGAGTTIELVATHLNECGIGQLFVANRTPERAHELADPLNASAIRIGDIPAILENVDIVITATASQLPILGKGLFERVMAKRQGRRLLVADLAVPRDVEPEVGALSGVSLYNIDDLRAVIADNVKHRASAAEQAEAMIELYAANYMRQLRIHEASDIISHYRSTLIQQRDVELEKALAALESGKCPEAVLKNFARNFVNKAMHQPTLALRQAASEGRLNLLALAKDLFK